jgi:hypothetical protein
MKLAMVDSFVAGDSVDGKLTGQFSVSFMDLKYEYPGKKK